MRGHEPLMTHDLPIMTNGCGQVKYGLSIASEIWRAHIHVHTVSSNLV